MRPHSRHITGQSGLGSHLIAVIFIWGIARKFDVFVVALLSGWTTRLKQNKGWIFSIFWSKKSRNLIAESYFSPSKYPEIIFISSRESLFFELQGSKLWYIHAFKIGGKSNLLLVPLIWIQYPDSERPYLLHWSVLKNWIVWRMHPFTLLRSKR